MDDDLPEDKPGDNIEPKATATPPEGVNPPVETPYGPNTAVELPKAITEPPPTTTTSTGTGNKTPENKNPSVRLPMGPVLVGVALLLGGSFLAGTKLTKTKPGLATAVNPIDNGKPTTNGETKPRTNMFPDLGLYRRKNEETSWDKINSRLKFAQSQIFVITGNPNHPKLLESLQRKKKESGIPIFILTGKDTPNEQTSVAKAAGFNTYRVDTTLERPYCFLILDSKAILDASREHWYWESTEANLIQKLRDWAKTLMEGASID